MCRLVPYEQDKLVAEIKLGHIQNIAKQAHLARNIDRIMLFGSSTEERCTEGSDIDIAVFGRKAKNRYIDSREFQTFKQSIFQYDWNQDYDVLYFQDGQTSPDMIMRDIDHGVEIFRRASE